MTAENTVVDTTLAAEEAKTIELPTVKEERPKPKVYHENDVWTEELHIVRSIN